MRAIKKILNKENLIHYVKKIAEDEGYKKEFIKNCRYLQFDLKVADSNSDNCSLSIELIKGVSSIEWEIKKHLTSLFQH